ncbi:HlyD family efflux transporter periplasmic adaptor subunit [Mesobacterium sp. TK19101]|uniref:HlyD family efflux transporter periplasmic adaptor subunit n=1 Tax=Mesobacterium hydrothermale TaxID=3111907 RepID=A0ABU6HNS7_9RHOB|nr:HlyD family efflux transporter periplasmic adaptor subunit [Mesobacterium sp. TK19101]MEC3863093.1 HlyD family efflux transporter periplasmic adaptor subunit [Mesobacterium sp. TK19101]
MLCSIAILAGLLPFCDPPPPRAVGYVEGEYILVAPIELARIETLDVALGDRVEADRQLGTQEARDARLAVAEADAAVARAKSELADLTQGARAAEIDVAQAGVQSAKATRAEAEREFARVEDLFTRGVASQAQFDTARSALQTAQAKEREANARLDVLRLPARPDRIAAGKAAVAQATAALDTATWRLEQRRLVAPVAGEITDIYRHVGDLSGPQAPLLELLPIGGVSVHFFLPEASFSKVAVGDRLSVACDGCAAGLSVIVSSIADAPEFTPPVIYARETRQKLVYLVRARPDPASRALKPGQIVDVQLPQVGE